MAKVLNVDIKVLAPEKSIVPWAFATLANDKATRRVAATLKNEDGFGGLEKNRF
jgi:hypothetical protein